MSYLLLFPLKNIIMVRFLCRTDLHIQTCANGCLVCLLAVVVVLGRQCVGSRISERKLGERDSF